jgi:aminoglycoside 3-N-acetyltransferase
MDKNEIVAGLRKMGLKAGDLVLLHSSLASLGQVEGGAQTVVDAFLDVLGESGTLVVPTFGELGIITDVVKNHPKAVQSIHPKAGVAAIGRKAAEICQDHWKAETAHAEGTPYVRIAQLGGYVCLMGVDQDRSTTLHTVEELLRLPYLKTTKKTTFKTEEGEVTKEWKLFPGPHRDFIGLDRLFRGSGKMKTGRVGNSEVRLMKSQELIDVAVAAGLENKAFVLCDNPNCADCVAQRADITRDRLSKESFRLAASAGLAGRYVPQMIANLKASGIGLVELDFIEGQPVHLLKTDKIQKAVRELREAGCEVSALRSCAVLTDNVKFLDLGRDCGVLRAVMPLGADSASVAEEARGHGIAVSFYNLGMESKKVSDTILEMHQKGLQFGHTFNAAGFAAAGEKPFLFSYKQKLRRFIDQLDIEDALFDGSPARLAEGNAEIKEMISILRCASFSGLMVLGQRNRFVANLRDTVARLIALLDSM